MTRLTLTEQLARIVARDWSEADRREAGLRVLDWAGCAIAGRACELGTAFANAAPSSNGPDDVASWLGSFGSLLEMDDVHKGGLLHPGPVVIPAALAVAGDQAGPAVLDAIIAGYEAMIRLGRSIGPAHYALFHNTSTCGGLGAAVAAGRLTGLSRQQMVSAMGHAISIAGGLWQCRNEPGATKHLHVAEAARRGVMAARAAAAGVVAPRAILEGPQGFFAAVAPDGTPDLMVEAPDGPALIHEVSTKPWPSCRHAHPAIDAVLALCDAVAGRGIDRVEIATFRDALVFCDRPTPTDSAGARFSLQHAAAVVLADGEPGLSAFEPDALTAPRYAELREKVILSEDPAMTARYPAHFSARARLVLEEGSVLEAIIADALGDPENPVAPKRIADKSDALFAWSGLAADHRDALASEIAGLSDTGTAANLRAILLGRLRAQA